MNGRDDMRSPTQMPLVFGWASSITQVGDAVAAMVREKPRRNLPAANTPSTNLLATSHSEVKERHTVWS